MRVPPWSVLLLSMPAAACGGDDLTLPGPGDPAALSIVAGDGQRGPLGEALTDPLVVQLVDGAGLPVGGRAVVFRFTDDVPEATVDPESVPTDTAGVAAVRARLGRREGSQGIEALVAVPGEDLRVRFRLTALPVDDGADGGSGGGGGSHDGGRGGTDDGGSGGHGDGNGNGHGHD
jgi:hypothetical protein